MQSIVAGAVSRWIARCRVLNAAYFRMVIDRPGLFFAAPRGSPMQVMRAEAKTAISVVRTIWKNAEPQIGEPKCGGPTKPK